MDSMLLSDSLLYCCFGSNGWNRSGKLAPQCRVTIWTRSPSCGLAPEGLLPCLRERERERQGGHCYSADVDPCGFHIAFFSLRSPKRLLRAAVGHDQNGSLVNYYVTPRGVNLPIEAAGTASAGRQCRQATGSRQAARQQAGNKQAQAGQQYCRKGHWMSY